ncbi:YmL10 [Puttea exsequens]|nr:YmL10 [Puttea exsequens]
MPPPVHKLLRASFPIARPNSDILPSLAPFLYTQCRNASILGQLSENPSAQRNRTRLGRGPSSGKGKTSGRGHKGQKQHGKVPRGFNGGQTPDEVVRGKRGDHNFAVFQKDMSPLNLYKLQDWISQGRIDPSKPITVKELRQSRCVANVKDGVKLLAKGSETLTYPLNIIISRASKQAIAAIESAGGSVTTRYYTPFAVKKIMAGQMDPINSLQSQIPAGEATAGRTFCNRLPDPTGRKDIEYYRDSAHRGYLSYLVPEGQGPSLFYKTPGTSAVAMRKAPRGKKAAGENRIW